MPYSAFAIANYFLDLVESKGENLTPLKIQKLVFFAHGWYLALYDRPLVSERVEAWKWGPVISNLYHELKYFGRQPIIGRLTSVGFVLPGSVLEDRFETSMVDKKDEQVKGFLDNIWETHGKYSGVQLSNVLHDKGSPWYQVWYEMENRGQHGAVIDTKIIRDYYHKLATED